MTSFILQASAWKKWWRVLSYKQALERNDNEFYVTSKRLKEPMTSFIISKRLKEMMTSFIIRYRLKEAMTSFILQASAW
jgi:hypothetical protein